MNSKLLSSTLVYSFLIFLQPFISLVVLQPYYTHYFTQSEYGIFSLMTNISTLIALISAFGISGTFFTFYYDYHHDEERLKQFMGQILSFTIWATSIFMLLLLFVGEPLFGLLFKNEQIVFHPYGLIAAFGGIGTTMLSPFIVFLRNQKNLLLYTALILITLFIGVGLQLILVSGFGWGITGALLGKAIGTGIGAAIVLWLNRAYLSWRIDWNYFKKPFQFLKFHLPDSLLQWFYSFGDRLLVERLTNLSMLGIYSLLNVLTGAIEMACFAIRSATLPFLYEAYALPPEQQREQITLLYQFYISLVILSVSGMVLIVCNLDLVVGKLEYLAVQKYIFIYATGYLFSGISFLIFLKFFYEKNARIVFKYTILSFSLIFLLNLLLIPKYDLWGAVLASFFTRISIFLLLLFQHFKLFLPFQNRAIWLPILGVSSLLFVHNYLLYLQVLTYHQAGVLQFAGTLVLLFVTNSTLILKLIAPYLFKNN